MTDSTAPKTGSSTVFTKPEFLAGTAGQVFCVRSTRSGNDQRQNRLTVLLIPPFAEEMNRSRRFFTKLRHTLLADGASEVVLPDLYGTGDSAGDFNDATWQTWIRDLCLLTTGLRAEEGSGQLSVVGVRAGCLLINDMLSELHQPFTNTVFVHPETSGHDVVHRLLRMRVAARRFSGNTSESTEHLWQLLEAARSLEVGGYLLHSSMAQALKDKRLNLTRLAEETTGHWIELADQPSSDNAEAPSCSARYPDSWIYHELYARPFWQLYENEPEDELVSAIARCAVPVVL